MESGFDNCALCSIFRHGRSPSLKDELAVHDDATNPQEFIIFAIRLENHMRERHLECGQEHTEQHRTPSVTAGGDCSETHRTLQLDNTKNLKTSTPNDDHYRFRCQNMFCKSVCQRSDGVQLKSEGRLIGYLTQTGVSEWKLNISPVLFN